MGWYRRVDHRTAPADRLVGRTRGRLAFSTNMARGIVSILCIVVLLAGSLLTYVLQPNLHMLQGSYFENHEQWHDAIDQYTLAGEKKTRQSGVSAHLHLMGTGPE
ncbi:hypothetical protein KDW_59590 [Dictyobacter vulcani]|uniref:Uncharacterized protein n=1 Tax=Dictyobacter vulcani TaxID=2607529 RepID=A0A5J4KYZ1_9CHLR|nr:hypothetical protein [Dictyobacter vulcani]GER91797.1 hypothetical protein KDW_59590 [Dictyobacter vulcani]